MARKRKARTPFGEALNSLRNRFHIKRLSDMAARLGTSTSYLSAIEIGRKGVPPWIIAQLKSEFSLTETEHSQLVGLACISCDEFEVRVTGLSKVKRLMMYEFARNLPVLEDSAVRAVIEAMRRELVLPYIQGAKPLPALSSHHQPQPIAGPNRQRAIAAPRERTPAESE